MTPEVDVMFPLLTELRLAEVLAHCRDAGADQKATTSLSRHITRQAMEIEQLRKWVADLQSDMYVNCVYCGHRYGPADNVPSTMADALKAHIEQCPQHPMSALKKDAERYRWLLKRNPDYFNRIDAAMELEP